jgi:hypothetical protein
VTSGQNNIAIALELDKTVRFEASFKTVESVRNAAHLTQVKSITAKACVIGCTNRMAKGFRPMAYRCFNGCEPPRRRAMAESNGPLTTCGPIQMS